MRLVTLFVVLFLIVGCQKIEYKHDLGFISSASANSPEFFAYVGDRPCKDMDGLVGKCAKRLKRNQPLEMRVPPREYSYRAYFDCTNAVQGVPEVRIVPRGVEAKFVVPTSAYGMERLFNCSLLAAPLDRPEPIAAFAHISVSLIDEDYQTLEVPYLTNQGFVFGQHAYYVMYLTDDGWKYATELTQLPPRVKIHKAFVESYVMRGGAYGF